MSKLIKQVAGGALSPTLTGTGGKKKRKPDPTSAKAQAAKLGATVGDPSAKAQAASARAFGDVPTVSAILGGTAGPGFGGSSRGYRRRPLQRSR